MEAPKCQGKLKSGKDCGYKAVLGNFCKIHGKNTVQEKPQACITITYGDVCENHAGMEKIGQEIMAGFDFSDLLQAKKKIEELGGKAELINLTELLDDPNPEDGIDENAEIFSAYILVVRGGANLLLKQIGKTADDMFQEHKNLTWDTKAKMKGKVVNKHARHNLCYADVAHPADYENGKGTVVAFGDIPLTAHIRKVLPELLGAKAEKLVAEGNLYYDVKKCGISWHGDFERRVVVAFRFGASMPLRYQWYYRNKKVGKVFEIILNHGDMYVMDAKSVGTDWKKSSILTLRHAAGCQKYIQ